MTTVIDYALLAGASYYDTRADLNRFPLPENWSYVSRVLQDTSTGFEASAFTKTNADGSTEIVISYAGTDPGDWSGDIAADLGLAAGLGSSQLLQAAQYYLQVKAANPNATISFTGHSLGGGLASLVAAFFGETAFTFDQAPFLKSALIYTTTDPETGISVTAPSVVQSLRDSLAASGASAEMLAKLDAYIAANDPLNTTPVAADTLAARSGQVFNINTEGEFLSSWFLVPSSNRIGAQIDIRNNTSGVSGLDLHSQALLTAYLQSNQSAVTSTSGQVQSLSEVTYKLQDLLKMIFDKNLYSFDTGKNNDKNENFLERLVKHEATVIDPATGETDAMVKRFTTDLWKLAQDGGLTLKDGSLVNPDAHYVSNALIAFAMQKYYEETDQSVGSKQELFTDLANEGGSGGIRFDMAAVTTKFKTAFDANERLTLSDAKGYEQYFKTYLQQSTFTVEERSAIASMLPSLRDWYVQAGAGGMTATDTLNRGAFMLGGAGDDSLTGGTAADLLVGNAGNDRLNGGAGADVLLGGMGTDTLDGGAGNDSLLGGAGADSYQFSGNFGLDSVQDTDGQGSLNLGAGTQALTGGKQIAASVWESDDRQYRYTQVEGQLIVSLNTPAADGLSGAILVKDWVAGDLGLALAGTAAAPVTTNTFIGDFAKAQNEAGTDYLFGSDGNYLSAGVQPGAPDLITGSAGADLILGLGGDDALLGRAGDDVIEGGEGNDVLQGGLGRDTLNGGAGNDLIYGSSNGWLTYPVKTDFLPPSPPYPIILGQGFNWVRSTLGPDADGIQNGYLSSTVGRDEQANDDSNLIDGGAGMDVIFAGTGSDVVHGGDDTDDIYGMAGNDLPFGDGGNDRIYGDGPVVSGSVIYTPPDQHGYDVLVGGAGNDLLLGQGKDDVLFGGADDDVLYGDDRDDANTPVEIHGNDYLDGGAGTDKLYGNGGDDILIGGTGDDTLEGGAGQDTYIYNVGDGIDTITDTKSERNILRFGAGVNKDNITLRLGSLMLDLGNGDAVHIAGFDQNDVFNSSTVSGFEFADGSSLSTAELLARGFDLEGTAGDDMIAGTNTTDRIHGLAGNDKLRSGEGDDVLDGGADNDLLFGESGNDQLLGGDGADHLQGGLGNDVLDGGAGDDAVLGEEGNDQLLGGAGADELQGGDGDDVLDGGADNDVLFGQAGNDALSGGDGDDQLAGGSENDTLLGGAGNDVAWGEAGDDVLAGGAGNDTLQGGLGNDAYQFGRGDGQDRVYDNDATAGNIDRVEFAADVSSDEVSASQQMFTYDLRLEIDGTNDALTVANYFYSAADQVEEIRFSDGTVWTPSTMPTLVQGTWDSDWLTGTAGADIFKSGAGNDVMQGDAGNDSYRYFRGDGADFISDYDTTAGNMDKIVFGADIAPVDVRVSRSDNNLLLAINAMDSVLVSNYFLNDGASPSSVEQIKFLHDGTVWDVETVKQMALAGTSGNDMLIGYATDDNLTGFAGDDTLQGGSGNDTLDGGAGNDSLQGGTGNDVFVFTRGGGRDTVTDGDTTAGNIDTIQFAADISPADVMLRRTSFNNLEISVVGDTTVINVPYQFFNSTQSAGGIERIQFLADGSVWDTAVIDAKVSAVTEGDDILFGSDLQNDTINGLGGNDALYGGSGNDALTGGTGNDSLYGGTGSDTYVVGLDSGMDIVSEDPGGAAADIDQLMFVDNISYADVVFTRDGSDLLIGSATKGFSIRLVNQFGTDINANGVEQAVFTDGKVLDRAALTHEVMKPTAGDDVLEGDGTNESIDGLGGNDVIYGRGGDDILHGGAGDDTLYGGTGNDTYVFQVGDGYDVMNDNDPLTGGGGVDAVSFGSGIAASSVMLSRQGNDLLLSISGTDKVCIKDYYSWGNFEQVKFADGTVWTQSTIAQALPINGTNSHNTLYGTNAADFMNGLDGDDVIYGLAGDDTLDGGEWGVDTLYGGDGNDLLIGHSSYNKLYGGNGDDVLDGHLGGTGAILDGGAGNDTLWGGSGADSMSGGAGDDAYIVTNAFGVITEYASEGVDTVQSSVTFTLGAYVENLTLAGTTAVDGTGNELDNVLIGNSGKNTLISNAGNDTLDGGAGVDTMQGGVGDDTYIVDSTRDNVIENLNEGMDTVKSSVSYTLAANIENLTLTGIAAINGTGNGLNNLLTGNSAANTLSGLTGNDILQGGAGNDVVKDSAGNNLLDAGAGSDILTGAGGNELFIGGVGNDTITTGAGADIIAFNRGDGQDIVVASTGTDNTISLGGGINYANLAMKKSGNDLILDTGNSDQITLKNWYKRTSNQSVLNLQIVLDSTAYNPASADTLLNQKVQTFSFTTLVNNFDQALAINPTLNAWSMTDALLTAHLSGSDSAALGGDLAYQYNLNNSLAGVGLASAQTVINDANFGATAQTLRSLSELQTGSVRLA